MIKELRPVLGVVRRPKNVHHHEVLNVEVFSPILELVDVSPADPLHLADHGQVHGGLTLARHG